MRKLLLLFVLGLLLLSGCKRAAEETIMQEEIKKEDINMYVTLNDGNQMPILGLGTWTLKGQTCEDSVYHALKTGYRLIDTARYYGNEKDVGRGIQRAIEEGFVKRKEIFVTSKIMPSDYDRAYKGIEDSLKDLGLDYLDLILIHQPGYDDESVYRAMEEALKNDLVKSIGISNYYSKEQVDEVLSYAKVLPAVIQNENHIYYQNNELREYVKTKGIVIESWYPFGGRGHTAENFENEMIVRIAQETGKTPAQVILRWQIQEGYIVIPGSSNPDHIEENFDIFDFSLSEKQMKEIEEVDNQSRYENW